MFAEHRITALRVLTPTCPLLFIFSNQTGLRHFYPPKPRVQGSVATPTPRFIHRSAKIARELYLDLQARCCLFCHFTETSSWAPHCPGAVRGTRQTHRQGSEREDKRCSTGNQTGSSRHQDGDGTVLTSQSATARPLRIQRTVGNNSETISSSVPPFPRRYPSSRLPW